MTLKLVGFFTLLATALSGESTMDWISGHWCGGSADERIEELWLPAHGGVLLGLGRTLTVDRTANFEYMRIVTANGATSYIAHPDGAAPTSFKQTAGGPNWARFENPAHDFPTRVEYRRRGDALHAEIAGPGEGGKEVVIPYDYARCAPDSARKPD